MHMKGNTTKIKNSGQYMSKAPEQSVDKIKASLEKNGDMRAAKTGGQKATGAI